MRTIINKISKFIGKTLDVMFYVVVCWHIAISHQPEPEVQQYSIIEAYELGYWATTDEFVCVDFVLKEKDSFLGFHIQPAYDNAGQEIKCRYTLNRPTDWEDLRIHPR